MIASSLAEAADLVRMYSADRRRVSVVHPGVDLELFRPRRRRPARGEPLIVFAGRLERLKGAETALRAFACLTQRHSLNPPPRLAVIGGDSGNGARESAALGGEKERLRRLAVELGIAESVAFLGPLDQRSLATWLARGQVCVVPSYTESFGMVALEAAASGTPVVAARVGGLPTIVKDGLTGFTVESRDPGVYAERIARLLQDPDLHQCFSRRSRMVACGFSWADTVDRLLSEYGLPAQRLEPAAAG
jgi:D-inositol-3-phosphate glycosyltransferase